MQVKKVALFVGLTFLVSYSVVRLYFVMGGTKAMLGMLVLSVGYMFIPLSVALIVQKLFNHAPLKEPCRINFRPNRWFLIAWLLPPVLALATLGVSLLFPGIGFSPEMAGMYERFQGVLPPEKLEETKQRVEALPVHPFWLALLQGLVAGITVNAVAAFGEELGWRGLLLRELESLGFWRASTVIGIVWGFWHAPLIVLGHNYPQHPWAGVFMMTAMTVLLSPILSYVTLRANSVLAAAIFHGTFNATAGLAIMVVEGGNDLTVGVTGLAGFVVLIFANIGLFIFDHCFPSEAVVNVAVRPSDDGTSLDA